MVYGKWQDQEPPLRALKSAGAIRAFSFSPSAPFEGFECAFLPASNNIPITLFLALRLFAGMACVNVERGFASRRRSWVAPRPLSAEVDKVHRQVEPSEFRLHATAIGKLPHNEYQRTITSFGLA